MDDENILVGTETADDAGVYRISDEQALVLTTDFFTPIVNDPYSFGAIAATNAMSDVYAMGGRPMLAVNLVGFPQNNPELPLSVLSEILKGGSDKAIEAGMPVLGGHTIDDAEPKYGMAVVGTVHPEQIVRNVGAQPGDLLVLSKPLGTGVVSTAIKQGRASDDLVKQAIEVMATLNRSAAEAMLEVGVNACTDVTGFGLLGHLRGMTVGGQVGARVHLGRVPVMEGVRDLIEQGLVPGGTRRNHEFLQEIVEWSSELQEDQQMILADAQTSGGLLMAVSPDRAEALVAALERAGTPAAAVIGEIIEDEQGHIQALP